MRIVSATLVLAVCLCSALGLLWWLSSYDSAGGITAAAETALPEQATPAPEAAPDAELPRSEPGRTLTVPGRVTRSAAEAQEGSGPVPYRGVQVRLAAANDLAFDSPIARARTNRKGEFRLLRVPPGEYRLVAFAPEHSPRVLANVTIDEDGRPDPIFLHFGSRHSAHTDEPTHLSVGLSSTARPERAAMQAIEADLAAQAEMLTQRADVLKQALSVDLAAAGETFHAIPVVSTETLTLDGEDGLRIWTSVEGNVQMAFSSTRSARSDSPPPTDDPAEDKATIRGFVEDSVTNERLTGASVKLVGRGTDRSTQSDGTGEFRFRNVSPGEYAVTFDGMESGSLFRASASNVIVDVTAGRIQDVTLRAEPVVRIDRVVDGGQAQVAGMLPGDEILSYNGIRVDSRNLLRTLRADAPADLEIEMVVSRAGSRMSFFIHGGTIGVYTELLYR